MAIDNSVYWQGGTRFGPEWERLATGPMFHNSSLFLKKNNDDTADLTGFLDFEGGYVKSGDVILYPPDDFYINFSDKSGHYLLQNKIDIVVPHGTGSLGLKFEDNLLKVAYVNLTNNRYQISISNIMKLFGNQYINGFDFSSITIGCWYK